MAVDSSAPRSRRAILGAALGGLGAIVASRLATPDRASAATGDPVVVDGDYTGSDTTSFATAGAGAAISGAGPAVGVEGSASAAAGTGVIGNAVAGTGVVGTSGDATSISPGPEVGMHGFAAVSSSSLGVWGETDAGVGVAGTAGLDGAGVFANAGGWGVLADGFYGVYAYGRVGVTGDAYSDATGVYGFSGVVDAPLPPAGVGVQATAGSTSQIALNVIGKAKFSRGGRTYVATNAYSRRITMAGVTTSSYIIATLQTRRTGVYVHAVVPASGYFTIYMNKAVSATTYVGYLVIN